MSDKGQTSQEVQSVETNTATNNHQFIPDSQMASGYQIEKSSDMSDDDIGLLIYDWETCETLQIVKAFPVSNHGTQSDDQSSTNDFLVPEPLSVSGIIDSTISSPPPRTVSDKEENYIGDISNSTSYTNITVSEAPRKSNYVKRGWREMYMINSTTPVLKDNLPQSRTF